MSAMIQARAPALRAARWAVAGLTLAVAASVAAPPASAQPVPPPLPNPADHAFGCQLGLVTKTTIQAAIKLLHPQLKDVSVDFIVAHSVPNENDGQPLKANPTRFTGPIVCSFSGGVPVPPPPFKIARTTENTVIPDELPNNGGATKVDVLSTQQQWVLQYRFKDGDKQGQIEKRICQTVDGNTDCFRLFKP
jgi:hypothetical protein